MAKEPASAKTSPITSMYTEVYYSAVEAGTALEQIFFIQEIPALTTPKEGVTWSSLESDEERTAKGTRKAENIAMPVLYYESQSDKLYALADSEDAVWFFIKLPEATAETEGKPRVYKFKAQIDVANDAISIDGMLQETVTLYKQSLVTRIKGLPSGGSI